MNKYKISEFSSGYIIRENYVIAENEDMAYEAYENEEFVNEIWHTVKDDMSVEDVEITKIK